MRSMTSSTESAATSTATSYDRKPPGAPAPACRQTRAVSSWSATIEVPVRAQRNALRLACRGHAELRTDDIGGRLRHGARRGRLPAADGHETVDALARVVEALERARQLAPAVQVAGPADERPGRGEDAAHRCRANARDELAASLGHERHVIRRDRDQVGV